MLEPQAEHTPDQVHIHFRLPERYYTTFQSLTNHPKLCRINPWTIQGWAQNQSRCWHVHVPVTSMDVDVHMLFRKLFGTCLHQALYKAIRQQMKLTQVDSAASQTLLTRKRCTPCSSHPPRDHHHVWKAEVWPRGCLPRACNPERAGFR